MIEKQYPEGEYSLEKSIATFTQPSAILDYESEPVPGWFIIQSDIIEEVRVTNFD